MAKFLLVVQETESLNSGWRFKNSLIIVPFPTPDEPDIINNFFIKPPKFLCEQLFQN